MKGYSWQALEGIKGPFGGESALNMMNSRKPTHIRGKGKGMDHSPMGAEARKIVSRMQHLITFVSAIRQFVSKYFLDFG